MINIALDAGSGLAGKAVSPLMTELNNRLDEVFPNEICEKCEDVSIVLRVSGDVHDFGFYGCEKPKFNKRERSVEVDIGVAVDDWKKQSASDLKKQLSLLLSEAILMSYQLLLEKKILSDISLVKDKLEATL